MRIIISPAKKMNVDDDTLAFVDYPVFLKESNVIKEWLQSLSFEEIKELWNTHWLTNMGPKHKQLQKELEDYFGIHHVALYTNGHLALENAIAALNLVLLNSLVTKRRKAL